MRDTQDGYDQQMQTDESTIKYLHELVDGLTAKSAETGTKNEAHEKQIREHTAEIHRLRAVIDHTKDATDVRSRERSEERLQQLDGHLEEIKSAKLRLDDANSTIFHLKNQVEQWKGAVAPQDEKNAIARSIAATEEGLQKEREISQKLRLQLADQVRNPPPNAAAQLESSSKIAALTAELHSEQNRRISAETREGANRRDRERALYDLGEMKDARDKSHQRHEAQLNDFSGRATLQFDAARAEKKELQTEILASRQNAAQMEHQLDIARGDVASARVELSQAMLRAGKKPLKEEILEIALENEKAHKQEVLSLQRELEEARKTSNRLNEERNYLADKHAQSEKQNTVLHDQIAQMQFAPIRPESLGGMSFAPSIRSPGFVSRLHSNVSIGDDDDVEPIPPKTPQITSPAPHALIPVPQQGILVKSLSVIKQIVGIKPETPSAVNAQGMAALTPEAAEAERRYQAIFGRPSAAAAAAGNVLPPGAVFSAPNAQTIAVPIAVDDAGLRRTAPGLYMDKMNNQTKVVFSTYEKRCKQIDERKGFAGLQTAVVTDRPMLDKMCLNVQQSALSRLKDRPTDVFAVEKRREGFHMFMMTHPGYVEAPGHPGKMRTMAPL